MRLILPKIKNFLRSEKGICLCLLTAVFLVLAVANFPFGKWFLGWDNLVPELNFSLNFRNGIFAAWQENEGLGLMGGHGFAATLPHTLLLWLMSLVIPLQYLRPIFTLLSVYLGAMGCFFLSRRLQKKANPWISLVASLFYMLNFGTVQMFYIPLEAFSVHFAALPWLFYLAIELLSDFRKKKVLLFFLASFFFSTQGFIPQLFLVYFLSLGVICLAIYLTKINWQEFKKGLLILLLTVVANIYWLAPFSYYSLTNSNVYLDSYNNLKTTADFVAKSEKFGSLGDLVMIKGFVYEALDSLTGRGSFYIFQPWMNFFNLVWAKAVYGLFFTVAIFGVFFAIIRGSAIQKAFAFIFALAFVFLASGVFPFSVASHILRNNLPLFKQAFRIAFTKFSIVYSLSYSLLIAFGLEAFSSLSKGGKKALIFQKVSLTVLAVLIILVSFPVFKGNFFYDRIHLDLPKEYAQVFDFFKSQDKNTRIANFPQTSPTGWTLYRFGYSGSGFWWYGLEQPIMDRNFDVWSNYNENYYWEISHALYSKNRVLFESVLEKYQVNWLLVDGNVIDPSSAKALFFDELEAILGDKKDVISNKQSLIQHNKKKFELAAEFGKIKIYKVNLKTLVKDFVWMAEGLPVINSYDWGNLDGAYNEMGNYVSPSSEKLIANSEELKLKTQNSDPKYLIQDTKYNTYYPFRSLFTGRTTNDLDFEIEDKGDKFVFKKSLPKGIENYNLVIHQYKGDELVEVDKTDLTKVRYFIPTASVVGNIVEVVVPKVGGIFSAEIDPTQVPEVLTAKNCNQFSGGRVSNSIVGGFEGGGEKTLRLEAGDANNCSASFWLPDLPNKYGYLISAETKNISGKPLLFWVENLTNRKADMELYLRKQEAVNSEQSRATTDFLIQPPMAEDGLGYTLHFDNISIGRKQTINDLGKISVNPIPYKFLSSLKLINQDSRFNDLNHFNETAGGVNVSDLQGVTASHLEVKHPNPAVYEVKIDGPTPDNTTLVLSQAFHEGWKAYVVLSIKKQVLRGFLAPIFGKEIKEHIKVNNWENGWNISSKLKGEETTIVLVFWPQWLEYVGFVLLGLSFVEVLIILKGNLDVKSEM